MGLRLSLLRGITLRHRLLRRNGGSAIRGRHIPLGALTHAYDSEAANARSKKNCNYDDNDNWVEGRRVVFLLRIRRKGFLGNTALVNVNSEAVILPLLNSVY